MKTQHDDKANSQRTHISISWQELVALKRALCVRGFEPTA